MLRECFNDFIGHLRLERGLSLRTAKAYGSDMAFMGKKEVSICQNRL